MIINSFVFLLYAIVIIIPYFTFLSKNVKYQNTWLLCASYFFYGFADTKMIFLLLASTMVFYFLGIYINKFNLLKSKLSLLLTIIGCILGVGLLLYFKYLNFFIQQFAILFSTMGLQINYSSFNIILPIGISFFTFKLISYIVEIHRNNINPTPDFVTFATYIALFPTIMSGGL